MPNDFNADDIFEMAVKIEKNGAVFYRKAADQVDGNANKEFLLELADMEDAHEKTFISMREDLKEDETFSTTFDPEDENTRYLMAFADTRVFFKKEMPQSSLEEILSTAIQTEKDSIAFYLGMKELVPAKLGKERLDDIIKEEMSHIRMLANKLAEFE